VQSPANSGLHIARAFIVYRGIAHMIEIKTVDGVLSDAQRSVAAAVLAAGGHIGAHDTDEALACLDASGVPRARRASPQSNGSRPLLFHLTVIPLPRHPFSGLGANVRAAK
jgi:hypothetical protein